MSDINEIVEDLARDFPHALESEILRCVRQAVQHFFHESEAWRHTETIDVDSTSNEYYMSLPFDTSVLSLLYVYWNDGDNRYKLTTERIEQLGEPKQTKPTRVAHEDYKLVIDGLANGKLEVAATLRPTRTLSEIPDELMDYYFEYIRVGALYHLHSMPNKEWTDLNAAMVYEKTFHEKVDYAKRQSRQDRSRPRRVVKFNQGFTW